MKCFLCSAENHTKFNQVESFGFPLVYYQCDHCGLIFQSSDESRAGDPEFYAETYRKIYQGNANPTAKDLWVQNKRAAHLLDLIKPFQSEIPSRVLDIGASSGTLLQAFKQSYHCEAVGVEPGDAYREYAEAQGLRMVESLHDLVSKNEPPFEIISLIHVLEHLPDPVGTLRGIRETLLTRDGLLLIEVPNFYAHDSYELAHLICFTPHTLVEMLKKAEFRVKAMYRHGVPRSSLLNLYITIIAQPLFKTRSIDPVKPDYFVSIKRWIGFLYRRIAQRFFPGRAWLTMPEEGID